MKPRKIEIIFIAFFFIIIIWWNEFKKSDLLSVNLQLTSLVKNTAHSSFDLISEQYDEVEDTLISNVGVVDFNQNNNNNDIFLDKVYPATATTTTNNNDNDYNNNDNREQDIQDIIQEDLEGYGGGKFLTLHNAEALEGKFKMNNDKLKLPDSGKISDYKAILHQYEREISYWAHTIDRSVFFWGTKYFFLLYFKIYSKAFNAIGFKVKRRILKPNGVSTMTGNELARIGGSSILCLSFSNSGCYNTQSAHFQIRRYHKVNRLIFLRDVLWDKGAFCATITKGTKNDERLLRYSFPCWLVPKEIDLLKSYAASHRGIQYISKPAGEGAGKGIKVVRGLIGIKNHVSQYKSPHVVQTYLDRPHLIRGHKWDIRAFVLVTSTVPMRVYMYNRGIVRFAHKEYDATAMDGGDKLQFLTNTHISKKYGGKNVNVTSLTCSFEQLSKYLKAKNENYQDLIRDMRKAVSVTFLSAEYVWRKKFAQHKEHCVNCYQVLGVDIIVDADGNPKVIEVNAQPNLLTTEDKRDHYSTTKVNMVKDMIALVHNENTAPDEIVELLKNVDFDLIKSLKKREWIYLIDYINERNTLGGWLPVYPAADISDIHDHFFTVKRTLSDPPERIALHKILDIIANNSNARR